ncbi:MAG: glycosyltransferase family 2 protein [Deltaproteobacteria bacterium]|nr:glycosyltransferase family 2 protein [Deltaproteobacteria bacterium]MBW2390257.1 glycosyltransferase family 2 protein [Deltaproteobacteria bacterium]MBW2723164.1 glycosyltransferase family 2 protein [Deltaproteobacteria bacterium]
MTPDASGRSGYPLSVCVLACNDEEILARCLDSLGFADEILVVVDAKSTDGSEKIAREKATAVVVHRYLGDLEQKRHAISLAANEWVLLLDSDEVVSGALAERICEFLSQSASDKRIAGCEVNRLTFHLGRWLRHGDFYPDWKLRLFRRSAAAVVGRNPHGRVEVAGEVRRLMGDLEHYSYRNLADQIGRIQSFSDQAADSLYREDRRFRLVDLCLRPPARFLRAYALKRGFRDGMPGFIVAVGTAIYVFLKYAKLWELERKREWDA